MGLIKSASREQLLEQNRKDNETSFINDTSLPRAIDESHGDEADKSVAQMLAERDEKYATRVVEARLDEYSSGEDSDLVSRKSRDSSPVSDINMTSEAFDQKFRNAYAEAKKGERDLFSLHFNTGSPDVDPVDIEDSLVANRAGRISNTGYLPIEDAPSNLKNIGKDVVIKEAQSNLLSIDRRLFEIRLAAASEERQLHKDEASEILKLNSRKKNILSSYMDIG
jgi:hypothetical protein